MHNLSGLRSHLSVFNREVYEYRYHKILGPPPINSATAVILNVHSQQHKNQL